MSETDRPARADRQRLVLITGLSGSGKSTVAKGFEDLGFSVVDNLPVGLLRLLLEDPSSYVEAGKNLAVVTDVRAGGLAIELPRLVRQIDRDIVNPTVLFLEAADDTLVRRFSETRRPHPVTPQGSVLDGIQRERALLTELRGMADVVFDTSDWSTHDTRAHVFRQFGDRSTSSGMALSLVSFGFKHGAPPPGTDLLFDVRFLPNPYFTPELRPLSGQDEPIKKWLAQVPEYGELIARLTDLLGYLLPLYERENRSYLSIGIGCTGGRHRSVAVAEALAAALAAHGRPARVHHRDIDRP